MGLLFAGGSKEPEFVSELKLAETEHRLRSRLSGVLGLHGIELPETNTPTEFAVAGTVATVRLLMIRTGRSVNRLGFEERFVVGLFGFLIAHEFGRRTLADLGVAFAASALELFSPQEIGEIYRLGSSYRRLRQQKTMHRVLLQTISEWLDDPSVARLDDLAAVFDLCCRPN
jgi:hypothetical protein